MNYNKCKNEQDFKMTWFKKFRKYYADMFCIETEETIGGFPDVMALGYNQQAHFFEFKFTKTGKIKFQPTQPSFYKAHGTMDITILALWQREEGARVYQFSAKKLFEKEKYFSLNDKGEVDLTNAPMEGLFID